MAETMADWAVTPAKDESSDTDSAAEASVFASDTPRDHDSRATAGEDEDVVSGPNPVATSKRSFDPRRLFEEHPIAAAAIALGAIGLGVVGYRLVRRSLPVRVYLALRFGRFRELVRV
jgi:hypothetical protein